MWKWKTQENAFENTRETLLISSLFDMKVKLKNLLRKLCWRKIGSQKLLQNIVEKLAKIPIYKGCQKLAVGARLACRSTARSTSQRSILWPLGLPVHRPIDCTQNQRAVLSSRLTSRSTSLYPNVWLSQSVDRSVDRTWACACVHVGRPVGRPSYPSIDRSVGRKQPKTIFLTFF